MAKVLVELNLGYSSALVMDSKNAAALTDLISGCTIVENKYREGVYTLMKPREDLVLTRLIASQRFLTEEAWQEMIAPAPAKEETEAE